MNLTRRGWAAVGIVLASVGLAWLAGQRELNAIAAPVLVSLLLGAVICWRSPDPDLDRERIRPGFVGDTRRDTLHVAGDGVLAVQDDLPPALDCEPIDAVVAPPQTIETDLDLAERGVYRLGPPTVTKRDPLGLVASPVAADATVELVVYPHVYDVGGDVGGLLAPRFSADRGEFDHLREYVPGDPMREVNWKASAKHGDLLVMEFGDTRATETVHLVADAAPGCADDMAAAAATVADGALGAGLTVTLTLPGQGRQPGGESTREAVLRTLAQASAGEVPDAVHEAATVSVRARPDETRLRIRDRETTLTALVAGQPGDREVAAR